MTAQVRRHIAHLEPALGIAVVAVGGNLSGHRRAVDGLVFAVGGQHRRRVPLSVIKGQQQIGARRRVAGIDLQRPPAGRGRLGHAALKHEDKTQAVMETRVIGVCFQGPGKCGFRIHQPSHIPQKGG